MEYYVITGEDLETLMWLEIGLASLRIKPNF